MAEGRYVQRGSSEEFLHREVWRVVERQVDRTATNPSGGFYDDLVAMVFAFLALEGYVNFMLQKVEPELWNGNKQLRYHTPTLKKLRMLHARCGLPEIDEGAQPYCTAVELHELRNTIAHPKMISTAHEVAYDDGAEPPLFAPGILEQKISRAAAIRARDDVREIANRLHVAATQTFPKADLGPDPFCGLLALESSVTRLAD